MWRVSPLALAALLACACPNKDVSAAAQVLDTEVAAPDTVTIHSLFHGNPRTFRAQAWDEGPWGECSQKCGSGGVRSRAVTCQKIIAYISDIDYSIKSIVPDKECFDLLGLKPEVFQKCNEDISCPTWFVGHWRPCDKLCDEGKQTRQVVCYQKKDGRIEVLDEKDCTEKKPDEEQPCMLQHCDGVDWVVSGWSGCDSCTSKNRTRVVVCTTKGRQVLNDSFCSYHNRPVDHKECNKEELPACEAKWFADQWSKCSAKCGDGVQTRRVFCGIYYSDESGEGVAVLDDAKCANLTKYEDTKPCTVPKEECPSQWFAGPWTECTEECGGGEQFRRVMCLRGDKEAADCDGATVLDSTQLCNTWPCDPDNLLPISQTSAIVMGEEPRKKLDCSKTKFGCCPDKKSSAFGPFDEGCLKSRTCKSPESTYGCCRDGLSPAEGPNNDGCPAEPCADTLFGCCTSDNKTAAQGNDQDGCPSLPSPCDSFVYGCCADNETKATGPLREGCPETDIGDANGVVTGELGKPLLVHCSGFGYPPPAVFWFRGYEGINLLHNDTVYEVSGAVLLIRSLSIEALGYYECLAHIGEGTAVTRRVVVQAYKTEGTFTESESIAVVTPTTVEMINSTNTTTTEAPRPLFSDTGDANGVVTGELGKPLLLHCSGFAYPLPAVFWFRGYEGINLLHNDTVYEVSGNVLLIRSLSIEALGLYTCLAHIGEGMPLSWRVVVQAYKPKGTFTKNDSIADKTPTTADMINSTNTTTTEAPRPLFSDLVVPVNCIDDYFDSCDQIVLNKFCKHKYYSKYCCKSCVEAGQLDPPEAELQADQTL